VHDDSDVDYFFDSIWFSGLSIIGVYRKIPSRKQRQRPRGLLGMRKLDPFTHHQITTITTSFIIGIMRSGNERAV